MAIVNDADVFPPKSAVDAFVHAELPRSAKDRFYGYGSASSTLATAANSYFASDSVTHYLLGIGMAIEYGGGIMLTKVGRAFEIGVSKREQFESIGAGIVEVAGRLEDPVTYAKMLTEIDKQIGALVVDPYLPSGDLLTLISLPNVKRVLSRDINANGQKKDERRRHLAIALGARPEVELRFLPLNVKELHDRIVLPSPGGEGLMIGTSLGGTQLTVITHLSRETTDVLREHYEGLWKQAVKLDPIERVRDVSEAVPPAKSPSEA